MTYAIKDDFSAAMAVSSEKDVPRGWHFSETLDPSSFTESRSDVENRRRIAYADPISGSDRFMIEYQAELLAGDAAAAESAKVNWLARRAEIAAENPYPGE